MKENKNENQSYVYEELIRFLNVSLRPSIKEREDFNRSSKVFQERINWNAKNEKTYSKMCNAYCFSTLTYALLSARNPSKEGLFLTLYFAPFPLLLHLLSKYMGKKNVDEYRKYAKLLQELAESQSDYKFPFDVNDKNDFEKVANYVEEFTNMDYDSYIALLRHIRGEEEMSK